MPSTRTPASSAPTSFMHPPQVEKNRKGGKLVSVYHSGTSRQITLQSPACRLPWGVSAYTDNGTAEVSDR